MRDLEFRLLGSPQIKLAGQLLKFPSRKALALLIYLLVEKEPQFREKLTALFWPQSDSATARVNLRRTLAYVRETLGEAMKQVIQARGDQLEFNFTFDYYLDIVELETLRQAALSLAVPALVNSQFSQNVAGASLEKAMGLFRGEFLEGFSLEDAPEFEDWLSRQREKWQQWLEEIFDRYSSFLVETNEVQKALEVTQAWLRQEPLNETACQRLMQIYLASGKYGRASQVYQAYEQHLWEELKLKPSKPLQALAERVLVASRQPGPVVPVKSASAEPTPGQLEVEMVGREAEFSRLIQLFHRSVQGNLQLAVVVGEAGMGKTRLVTEFVKWARAEGVQLLTGQSFETNSYLPYHPLVELFRNRLEQENALDDLLSDVWLAELSRLLPELRERLPDLSSGGVASEDEAKVRLFEAFAILGQALIQKKAALLFLEDWQWADQASLDLLQYLLRRWHTQKLPVMVLLNLRAEALVNSHHFTSWLAALERDIIVTRLELSQLTEKNTIQLLKSLGASETPGGNSLAEFADWLYRETAGRPFFITETLKALLERGLLSFQPAATGNWRLDYRPALERRTELRGFLPRGVKEIIRARLSRLNQTASSLLEAGAVLGHGFSFDQLSNLTGLAERETLAALEGLVAGGLFIEQSAEWEEIRYFFSHNKILDVAYTEAGDARRRLLHRRALALLETGPTSAAGLAHHALAAHLPKPTFHYSIKAGDEAMKLFAVREAQTHYQRAYKLIPQLEASQKLDSTTLYRLFQQLGRTYELTNDVEPAREVYQRLLNLAETENNSPMICVALNQMVHMVSYSLEETELIPAWLERAIAEAKKSGDTAGLALSRSNLARYNLLQDLELTRTNATEAYQLAREAGMVELEARSLNILAYAEADLHLCSQAEAHAEASRQSYLEQGNRAMVADCLCILSIARSRLGRTAEAIDTAQEAYELYTQIENSWGVSSACFFQAIPLLEKDQYHKALARSQQGLRIAREINHNFLLIFNLTMLGASHYALGESEAGREALLEALHLSEHLPMNPFITMVWSQLAVGYGVDEAWEEAAVYARRVLSSSKPVLTPILLPYPELVKALVRQGKIELARAAQAHFAEKVGANPRLQIAALHANSWLAYFDNQPEQGLAYLGQAYRLAEQLDLPHLTRQINRDIKVMLQNG